MLLEDTGALIGLLFALIGISLAEITGNPRWDALGSIGIGLLLGVIAVILAVEMKSLLIGESVAPAVDDAHPGGDPRRPRGEADHPPAHAAPRPRRRAARGQARVHVRRHPVARARDRHGGGACASLVPDRASHLLRARPVRRHPRESGGASDDRLVRRHRRRGRPLQRRVQPSRCRRGDGGHDR